MWPTSMATNGLLIPATLLPLQHQTGLTCHQDKEQRSPDTVHLPVWQHRGRGR